MSVSDNCCVVKRAADRARERKLRVGMGRLEYEISFIMREEITGGESSPGLAGPQPNSQRRMHGQSQGLQNTSSSALWRTRISVRNRDYLLRRTEELRKVIQKQLITAKAADHTTTLNRMGLTLPKGSQPYEVSLARLTPFGKRFYEVRLKIKAFKFHVPRLSQALFKVAAEIRTPSRQGQMLRTQPLVSHEQLAFLRQTLIGVNKSNERGLCILDKSYARIESAPMVLQQVNAKTFVFQGGFAEAQCSSAGFHVRFVLIGVGVDREMDLFYFGQNHDPNTVFTRTGRILGNVDFQHSVTVEQRRTRHRKLAPRRKLQVDFIKRNRQMFKKPVIQQIEPYEQQPKWGENAPRWYTGSPQLPTPKQKEQKLPKVGLGSFQQFPFHADKKQDMTEEKSKAEQPEEYQDDFD